MASVHTKVTVQAFTTQDGKRMIFCAHTQEGEGLVERLVLLFKAKTNLPGADMYAS